MGEITRTRLESQAGKSGDYGGNRIPDAPMGSATLPPKGLLNTNNKPLVSNPYGTSTLGPSSAYPTAGKPTSNKGGR